MECRVGWHSNNEVVVFFDHDAVELSDDAIRQVTEVLDTHFLTLKAWKRAAKLSRASESSNSGDYDSNRSLILDDNEELSRSNSQKIAVGYDDLFSPSLFLEASSAEGPELPDRILRRITMIEKHIATHTKEMAPLENGRASARLRRNPHSIHARIKIAAG